jgi:hypothetical protein
MSSSCHLKTWIQGLYVSDIDQLSGNIICIIRRITISNTGLIVIMQPCLFWWRRRDNQYFNDNNCEIPCGNMMLAMNIDSYVGIILTNDYVHMFDGVYSRCNYCNLVYNWEFFFRDGSCVWWVAHEWRSNGLQPLKYLLIAT